ncbi:MAG: RluA family pseudouridine synthase [Spirochaetales bacterium]|nr:RluA family pseudouridine synthase [Spirochaetales bacterium]
MKYSKIEPGQDDLDRRIDRLIRKFIPQLTLGEIYKNLRTGWIRINGKKKKPDYRLKSGDIIEISDFLLTNISSRGNGSGHIPANNGSPHNSPRKLMKTSQRNKSSLKILAETDDLLVLNKPAGVLVHGEESLEIEVGIYLKGRIPESLSFKPGPLHRLDRNTSGIISFGKSLRGSRLFSSMMQSRALEKYYLSILKGKTEPSGIWEDELVRNNGITRISGKGKGKSSKTSYQTLTSNKSASLVLMQLHTGRTHQIRAQAAGHGHPLMGDNKYGGGTEDRIKNTYYLHAWLMMPVKNGQSLPPFPLSSPLPPPFQQKIRELFPQISLNNLLEEIEKKIVSGLEEVDGKYTIP